MFDLAQLERAHGIVGAAVPPTPAHAWPLLSERLGAIAIVKHENHTPTGAFKVRGGLVYVDALKRERPRAAGLISATRGNHGQRRIARCGRLAPTWSSTVRIFSPPPRRRDAAPGLTGSNSCRRSILVW
jgi:threonine dehydratase